MEAEELNNIRTEKKIKDSEQTTETVEKNFKREEKRAKQRNNE